MAIRLNFNCHENWNNMTPSEQGRFCDSCAKNVFDLTNKSDDEIRLIYTQNKGKMCGRIRSTQLGRPLVSSKKMTLARFCLALFMVFGSLLFTIDGHAQTRHAVKGTYTGDVASDSLRREYEELNNPSAVVNNENSANTHGVMQQEHNYMIKGVVTDKETKEPLPFVSVYFEWDGKKYGAISDMEGNYSISVPHFVDPKASLNLSFRFVGYDDMDVKGVVLADLKKDVFVLDMDMHMQEMMLLGDIMIEDHNIINTDPEKQGETEFDSTEIRRSPY